MKRGRKKEKKGSVVTAQNRCFFSMVNKRYIAYSFSEFIYVGSF